MAGKLSAQMTEEERRRKAYLNMTAAKAARRLQAKYLEEYKRITAQVRREYPYEDYK